MAVVDVQAGGPAASAGVQPKDVIVAVDGQPVKDESDLQRLTAQHKPGETLTATVARGDQTQDVLGHPRHRARAGLARVG